MIDIPTELKSTTEIRKFLRTGSISHDAPITDIEIANIVQDAKISTLEARGPQRIYSAFMNQSMTDDPQVIPFENTVGDIVWTRTEMGKYKGSLPAVLTKDKRIVVLPVGSTYISPSFLDNTCFVYKIKHVVHQNYFEIEVETYIHDSLADDVLNNTFIEIRVYDPIPVPEDHSIQPPI